MLSVLLQVFSLLLVHDFIRDLACIRRSHLLIFVHGNKLAIESHLGRKTYCDMYVRSTVVFSLS